MVRNLKNKLQPAVFNLWCETWKSNCNQQYLIEDAKPEKQIATSSIYLMMRNLKNKLQPAVINWWCETWKTNCNQRYQIYDAKPENQIAISSI